MASSELRRAALALLLLSSACVTPSGRSLRDATLTSTTRARTTAEQLVAASQGTVFVFWSGGCPCVRRYQARIEALAAEWSPRGIAFVQVSSNAGETIEALADVAQRRGLKLPVWRDDQGALAEALDARTTPTVVFVARDGRVLYRGWVDNERAPGEAGREAWLEDALAGFSSGKPFAARTPTWGCTITRSLAGSSMPLCHVATETGATP